MADEKKLIPLSTEELAGLIREQSNHKEAVSCSFGTGVVKLKTENTPWALPLLAEWRGEAFNEGAGI